MKTDRRGLFKAAMVSATLSGSLGASAQSPAVQNPGIASGPAATTLVATNGTTPSLLGVSSIDAAAFPKISVPEAPKIFGLTIFGQERIRVEDWNWWSTPKANGAYTFFDSQLKLGLEQSSRNNDIVIELENPSEVNLPTKAVASSPQGGLGSGSTYFTANNSQNNVTSVFLKQAFVKFKTPGPDVTSFQAGRFEYTDGTELQLKDPTLSWLAINRVSGRLLSTNPFSNVNHSYDGFVIAENSPSHAVDGIAAFPTRGVYDNTGGDTLTGVKIASLDSEYSSESKSSKGLARLFAVYYEDDRSVTKVDDRSTAAKNADHNAIRIENLGGDYSRVVNIGPGKFDILGWFNGQFGSWGKEEQAAFAYDAEAGYQFTHASWDPWIRAGISYYSGDGNPNNNTHGTYIPLMASGRQYFRDQIAAEANLQDLFLSLIWRSPVATSAHANSFNRYTIRSEVHAYALANRHDLWYTGSGAYNDSNFGYTGRATGGFGSLATTADIEFDYQPTKSFLLSLYFSYADGGDVIADIYKSRNMTDSFVEATYKF